MVECELDQQREVLIRRRHALARDLQELAPLNATLEISDPQARRKRIAAELHEIETRLAELHIDERSIASMEGRE